MTTAERHRGETDSPWVWSLRASETWRTFLEMFDTWKMKRNKEHCPPHHWISSWKSFFHVAWKRALLMKEILRHFIFGQIPSVFILFDETEHNFYFKNSKGTKSEPSTLSKLRSYENSSFWRLLDVWGRVRGAVCWVQVGYGYARGGRCLGTLGTLVRCEGTTEGYVGYAVWEQCVCLLVAVVLLCCLHHTTNQIQWISVGLDMDWAIYGTLIVQQWPAAMTPAGLSKGQLFFLVFR